MEMASINPKPSQTKSSGPSTAARVSRLEAGKSTKVKLSPMLQGTHRRWCGIGASEAVDASA